MSRNNTIRIIALTLFVVMAIVACSIEAHSDTEGNTSVKAVTDNHLELDKDTHSPYLVAEASTRNDLEALVNHYYAMGYRPTGGIFKSERYGYHYMQAMVLEYTEE